MERVRCAVVRVTEAIDSFMLMPQSYEGSNTGSNLVGLKEIMARYSTMPSI